MRRQRRGVDMGPRVDLHCHSVASDGLERAETLVERAATSGLSALAITDHDLPPVIPPGLHTVGTNEIRIIAGVELSTMHLGKELHLLVYFPDVMPPDFAAWCRARAKWRAEWFDTCAEALGLAVRADADATAGRRTLTRLHLAREVVSSGLSRSLRDAFDEHVGHKSTVIPPLNLAFLDALAAAKAAGGWTSWRTQPLRSPMSGHLASQRRGSMRWRLTVRSRLGGIVSRRSRHGWGWASRAAAIGTVGRSERWGPSEFLHARFTRRTRRSDC